MKKTLILTTMCAAFALAFTGAKASAQAPEDPGAEGRSRHDPPPAVYTIIPILESEGGIRFVTDMNENMQTGLVGYAELPDNGGFLALHYEMGSPGVTTQLAGGSALAHGTNDWNQIVGARVVDGVPRPVFWSEPSAVIEPVELNMPADAVYGEATDINNDGIVVGYYVPDSGPGTTRQIGLAWRIGVDEPVLLPPLPGDSYTVAVRVNELFEGGVQVAGDSFPAEGAGVDAEEAVLWSLTLDPEEGTLADPDIPAGLGTVGQVRSYAAGLNDWGDVVGTANIYPFIAPAGEMAQLLPFPEDMFTSSRGRAFDVNNFSDVIGELAIAIVHGRNSEIGSERPYLWKDGELIDLETQVELGDWLALWEADQINDAGLIAGFGLYGEEKRAFLLVPIELLP